MHLKIALISKLYIKLASIMLFATGCVKLVSAMDSVPILAVIDPVFSISTRNLLILVGIFEVVVGFITWIKADEIVSHMLVFWTVLGFIGYRVTLHYLAGDHLCPCLGIITNWVVWWTPSTTDWILSGIIIYLACGTSVFLAYHYSRRQV